MRHDPKARLGRKLQTVAEYKAGIPWYRSSAWQKRKDAIAARIAKRHARTAARKEERAAADAPKPKKRGLVAGIASIVKGAAV